ncbi:MAG: hypothetical protein PHS46_08545 [Candidatus Omnitrophica bacterium]|nr:hypothetical protein [Candidatus Omnitrophota bacterium]
MARRIVAVKLSTMRNGFVKAESSMDGKEAYPVQGHDEKEALAYVRMCWKERGYKSVELQMGGAK